MNNKLLFMKNKIILLGMMCSGKTTLGKILSKKLKIDFCDTDNLIEKKCGLKINKIFEKHGEKFFRKKEEKIVFEILKKKKAYVIALGGGTFLNKKIQKEILKNTISIWLKASFDTIYQRSKKSKNRPLLKDNKKLKTIIKKLLKSRSPIYSKAHLNITINKQPNILCNRILKRVSKIENLQL